MNDDIRSIDDLHGDSNVGGFGLPADLDLVMSERYAAERAITDEDLHQMEADHAAIECEREAERAASTSLRIAQGNVSIMDEFNKMLAG